MSETPPEVARTIQAVASHILKGSAKGLHEAAPVMARLGMDEDVMIAAGLMTAVNMITENRGPQMAAHLRTMINNSVMSIS